MALRKRKLAATMVTLLSFFGLATVAFGLPPFTTAPKSSPEGSGQAEVFGIATGCHRTFDRLVVRTRSGTPGYRVRYVRRVFEDATGRPVRLRGRKRLLVVIRNARGHTEGGTNLLPQVRTPLCPNLRQLKNAGDFEGIVTLGLGLRRKAGFRVFRLSGRIVVDIKH